MATAAGSLWVKLGLKDTEFVDGLSKAEKRMTQFGNKMSLLGQRMTIGLSAPLALFGAQAIKTAGEMEQAEVAFATLTGSVQLAKEQLEKLKELTVKTPFEFPELVQTTRQMLAMGFAIKDTIPMIKTIGNAVSALGLGAEAMNNMTVALGQMRMKGKVQSEEMTRQLGQYVNAWGYLAQYMYKVPSLAQVTTSQISKVMKQAELGMISGATGVKAVLEGLANDPKFKDGMLKQSQTLIGIWRNFKDQLYFALSEIGGTIVQTFDLKNKLNDFIAGLKSLTEWFKNLSPFFKNLIINSMLWLATLGPLILILGKFSLAISSIIGLFKTLSIALTPTGIIITGLVILVDLFRRLGENARIANLEIAKTKSLDDLIAKQKQLSGEIQRIENQRKHGDTKGGWLANGLGTVSPEEEKKLESLKKQLQEVNNKIKEINTVKQEANQPPLNFGIKEEELEKTNTKLESAKLKLAELKNELEERQIFDDTTKDWEKYTFKLEEAAKKMDGPLKNSLTQIAIKIRETGQAINDFDTSAKNQNNAIDAWVRGQEYLNSQLGKTIPEWEKMARELEKAASESGVIPSTRQELLKLAQSIRDIGYLGNFNQMLADMGNWSKHVVDIMTTTAQSMSQSMSDFFFDAMTGQLKSLGDYVTSFLQSIVRAFANAMAQMFTQKLMSRFFGGMSIPGFASGGNYSPGPMIVGERGPELMIPNTSGTVIPNNKLGGLAANTNMTIKVINETGNPNVQANMGQPTFDGQQWVANMWIKSYANNTGGLRDLVSAGG